MLRIPRVFVRPLFFSKTTGLLFEFDSNFYKQILRTLLEQSLSPRMLAFLETMLKRDFKRRKIYDPGFEKDLVMTFFYMNRK